MAALHLGFLASHGGSNMQAIINACKDGSLDAKPCCVISNNSDSFALERAKIEGIPFYHISEKIYPNAGEVDSEIISKFDTHGVDTVILAGYMKMLGENVIQHFHGRVLNIHPALLPKFGGKGMYGMRVHEAVLRAGEKVSGATVHLVDNQYDRGRILLQKEVPVMEDDSPEILAKRVLEVEHFIYPETLRMIACGKIQI
jgi:phosphoribosylglycinamide formyltransferase 1